LDYVVLDIEFNGRKFASDLPMEVIEIGAVRLDEQLRQTGEFSALIQPVYFAQLNSFIKEKTGIPQEAIDQAERFPKVITAFMNWLGDNDSFLLVTWGGEDLKRIVLDTRMHQMDDAYWLGVDYFDLLKGYIRYRNMKNDISVEAALAELDITPEGSAHRALDDAKMTAEIFRAVIGHMDLKQVKRYKDMFTNAKERRLVKNAVRALKAQKSELKWETVVEHFLQGKVATDNEKKMAELYDIFKAETKSAGKAAVKEGSKSGSR